MRFFSGVENDKENDSRTAQATQAVIQRRRRPKRRSTGVVHVDMDVSTVRVFLRTKLCNECATENFYEMYAFVSGY